MTLLAEANRKPSTRVRRTSRQDQEFERRVACEPSNDGVRISVNRQTEDE